MTSTITPTVVIVPGLRDHVESHWQTVLASSIAGSRIVPPLEADRLDRAAQVAALDAVVDSVSGPIVLVAHSAGVMTTVHWAATADREVAGALLATPADLEMPLPEGYPTHDRIVRGGWTPIPRRRLPFRSIVAASANDPLAGYRRVAGMAEAWGSRLVNVGAVGHLNPAAGYGHWPESTELLDELLEMRYRSPASRACQPCGGPK